MELQTTVASEAIRILREFEAWGYEISIKTRVGLEDRPWGSRHHLCRQGPDPRR
jgi:hypothetical protein